MRNVVAIAICLAGMTMFSGCNKDEGVYTIKYSPGMYSSGQNYSQSKSKGESVTLRDATYTRDGFTQTGWSTKADGSVKDYSLNGTYSDDVDVTLFPFWKAGDDPGGDTKYTLPTNVKFTYEDQVGDVITTTTSIKIGNNYYWKTIVADVVDEHYMKYNNGSWTEYEKAPKLYIPDWSQSGTYNAEDKDYEIETFFLNFMVSEWWYVDMETATKGGKETIAGVSTDVYTITSYGITNVLNHDPVTNLFFKVTGNGTPPVRYEVTSWDKSVTSFGITDLP